MPKIKLPKINLHRRPPKTVYKVNSAEIFRPSDDNKAVNYDVMIAPGYDFELVTNNIVEEPEYSFIVDMSGDHPSSGNNYNKQMTKTNANVITTEAVPAAPDTKEPEIIYGSPDPDVYNSPGPVILDNDVIHQVAGVRTQSIYTPPSSSSKPVSMPVNLDIQDQDLQEGFIPSKLYIDVISDEKNGMETSEKLQKQTDIVLQDPVIKSTYEQQTPLSVAVSTPGKSQSLQFERQELFAQSPLVSAQLRPLPPFQSQFQELRSLSSLRRPPSFRAQFRDVNPDFRTLFPRQFRDEYDFQGFPLSQIYPSSLMSNIATFNSNTNLVDSKWLMKVFRRSDFPN